MIPFLVAGFALMVLSLAPPTPAAAAGATRVERVVSRGGIEAWLVRQTRLPIIAMDFAVRGGAAQDDPAKAGSSSMLAAMLDEGAGEFDSEAFHARLDAHAIELSFSSGRDSLSGSLRTLSDHRGEAFAMLRLALTRPRFDAAPMERVRQSMLASIRRASTNPNSIAIETFWAMAFPGHPYARRPGGTAETVAAVSREDLVALHGRVLAREHLKVVVVGDMSPDELVAILDDVFGSLPEKARLAPVPPAVMRGLGERRVVALDVPQTAISFGAPGLSRDDPDFLAGFVMNHILGAGSQSRLFTEVREKRGLAYSVSSGLAAFDAVGLFSGGTSTRNERAADSVALIEAELRRMGETGPTEDELDRAKRFLVGNWALRFDTSNAIAGNLLRFMMDGFGPDYVERRNGLIEAVKIADVRRVAARLLKDVELLVVAVGRPQGL